MKAGELFEQIAASIKDCEGSIQTAVAEELDCRAQVEALAPKAGTRTKAQGKKEVGVYSEPGIVKQIQTLEAKRVAAKQRRRDLTGELGKARGILDKLEHIL